MTLQSKQDTSVVLRNIILITIFLLHSLNFLYRLLKNKNYLVHSQNRSARKAFQLVCKIRSIFTLT